MPPSVADMMEREILVLEAEVPAEMALRAFAADRPRYVVVRYRNLFYSYPQRAWLDQVRRSDARTSLRELLDLDAAEPDTLRLADIRMNPDEVARLVGGAARPGRATITLTDGKEPVGVISLHALIQIQQDMEAPAMSAPPEATSAAPPPHGSIDSRIAPPPTAQPAPRPRRRTRSALRPPSAGSEPPPPPAAPPPSAAHRTLQPRAQVDFPAEVVVDETNALTVWISTAAGAAGAALAAITVAPEVTTFPLQIYVHATGLAIDGPNYQETEVPVAGAADPVDFMLRALPVAAPDGAALIRVRFKYAGKFIGQVVLQTVVTQTRVERAPIRPEPPQGGELTVLMDSPPPDLLIEVNKEGAGDNRFEIFLHSNVPGRRYHSKPAGVLDLGDSLTAATYTATLFTTIQQMDAAIAEQELTGIGNTLWNKLPEDFKDEYWALLHENPQARAIQIITDEAYIPWELLKPFRVVDGKRIESRFLGEEFAIGRWDPARPLPRPLTIRHGNVVVPDYPDPRMKLPFAQREIAVLQTVCGAQAVRGGRKNVIDLLGTPGWQLLHFACHGTYNGENPDLSQLIMEDNPVSAATIASSATGIGEDRPFVFLNACEVGKEGAALTQLGGWAETFCANGFSGFVGPLWEVDDEVACKASEIFYTALKAGATLGQALQRVRAQWHEARDNLRFNPTWLAYSLHSDPMLTVAWSAS